MLESVPLQFVSDLGRLHDSPKRCSKCGESFNPKIGAKNSSLGNVRRAEVLVIVPAA